MTRKEPEWVPPALTPFKTAHDVRRLRICEYCKHPGTSLLRVDRKTHAHGYCLVKSCGIDALATLPAVEIGKVTLRDVRGLGRPIDDIIALLDAADARERKV